MNLEKKQTNGSIKQLEISFEQRFLIRVDLILDNYLKRKKKEGKIVRKIEAEKIEREERDKPVSIIVVH